MPATATKKRSARRKSSKSLSRGWWGAGKSPAARWPGVTISINDHNGKYYFDKEEADRAAGFFPRFLIHLKGEHARRPFELEDWERDLIVRPLFGWKQTADGTRRFRKLFCYIPKKNGKSAVGSGLGLYTLYCDREPGAEVYSAAADREQAAIIFNVARDMVEESPALLRRTEVYRRVLYVPSTRSTYKVLSSDVKTKHGPNIHCLVFDELHTQPNRELWDTLTRGRAARRQPLVVAFTTAPEDLNGICGEEYEYAKKVIDGTIQDESLLPIIFEADLERESWQSPGTWRRVNPNLGISVKMDYLEHECLEAQNEPRKKNSFLRLHLNVVPHGHTAWLNLDEWKKCAAPVAEKKALLDVPAFGGLDLSSTTDLTSFVMGFRHPDEESEDVFETKEENETGEIKPVKMRLDYLMDIYPYFWMAEESYERRNEDEKNIFEVWKEAGYLRICPGPVINYEQIYAEILEEITRAEITNPETGKTEMIRLKVEKIGFDPWNATQFALNLESAGFEVVKVIQGYKTLSEPSKLLEVLVKTRRIRHAGNPLLQWCAGNCGYVEDINENIRPAKMKKDRRIDGISALINALCVMLSSPPPKASVYETRGLSST